MHLLGGEQLAAVLEVEGCTGGVKFRQCLQKIHVQISPLPRRQRPRQHVNGGHLIAALSQNLIPLLQTVPHLAFQSDIKIFPPEVVAAGHQKLNGNAAVLKLSHVVQRGKARHFLLVGDALHRADVAGEDSGHLRLFRERDRLLEEHLNQKGTPRLVGFLGACWLNDLVHGVSSYSMIHSTVS